MINEPFVRCIFLLTALSLGYAREETEDCKKHFILLLQPKMGVITPGIAVVAVTASCHARKSYRLCWRSAALHRIQYRKTADLQRTVGDVSRRILLSIGNLRGLSLLSRNNSRRHTRSTAYNPHSYLPQQRKGIYRVIFIPL